MTSINPDITSGDIVSDANGIDRVFLGEISDDGDYGLKVVGPDGSTVIIDGTSAIFGIAASGSHSVTATAGVAALVTTDLSLGFTYAPAHVSHISDTGGPTGDTHGPMEIGVQTGWVAITSGGATTTAVQVAYVKSDAFVALFGTDTTRVSLTVTPKAGDTWTRYAKFYILKEIAF
jgi:hypothetical protein